MSILSIQSHVAYGYVGNKAAVFPLQSMGYDVWPVNTVQFSNHTGYGKFQGDIFSREHIRNVIHGIENLGVTASCQGILSGYMGSQDICYEVFETVARFKLKNPDLIYLCDPVIGNSSCFVKPEVLTFFKENLIADIITPNQFEAETLSGITINTLDDLKKSAHFFHARGVKIVIITGVKISDLSLHDLYVFISDTQQFAAIQTPEYAFDIAPNGTGDLFSAVFLGNYLNEKKTIPALKRTLYFVDKVMQHTFEAKSRELKITQINYQHCDAEKLPVSISL